MKKQIFLLLTLISVWNISCTNTPDYSCIEFGKNFTTSPEGAFQIIKIFPDGSYRLLVQDRNDSNRQEFCGTLRRGSMDSINEAASKFKGENIDLFRRNIIHPHSRINFGLYISGYNCSAYWQDEYHEEAEIKDIIKLTEMIEGGINDIGRKYQTKSLMNCSDTSHFETYRRLKTAFDR